MKAAPTIAFLFSSMVSFAQCVKCDSYSEAEKDPTKVISLKINPNLGGEYLEEIPVTISQFTNLEVLFLTDLDLVKIPKEIGKLTKLKSLSFAGNQLEELPEEMFDLTNLKELILFSNNFSDDYKNQLKKKMVEKMPQAKLMID